MRASRFGNRLAACCTLIGLLTGSAVAAQDGAPSQDKWEFELTPYLFAAGIDGTVGARGVEADVDMSFSDIWDRLDRAFMLLFEARKGPWMFAVDAMYFRLSDEDATSVSGPFGKITVDGTVEVTLTQQVYTLMGGYRLFDNKTKLDLIGGLRYTRLDSDLDLVITTNLPSFPGGGRRLRGDESWWDPVVGVRVLRPFAERWTFAGYVDVGGAGSGSDLTYQAYAGANWQFGRRLNAKFGYRYLYQDFEDDGVVWDMATSGVFLGLGIQWPAR